MSFVPRTLFSAFRIVVSLVATAAVTLSTVSPASAVPVTHKSISTSATMQNAPVAEPDWPNEIYGTVLDDWGDPATDLQVDAVNSSGTVVDTVFTDVDGWYNFFELPAATYKLHFVGDANYEDEWYENVYTRTAGTGLAVSNSQGFWVDAEVTWIDGGGGGGGMGGSSAFEGYVTDSSDVPVENVDVTVFDTDGNSVQSAVTDADGYYLADGLIGGIYTVCFDSVDFPFVCLGGSDDPLGIATEWLSIGDGETLGADYKLTLMGSVSGRVSDVQDTPLEGMLVHFYQFAEGSWTEQTSATTDVDGFYAADVPEGYYRVVAEPQDSNSTLEPQWWSESSSSNYSTAIQVSSAFPSTDIDFALREGSSISVNAWCGSTGTECAEPTFISLTALDGTLVDDGKYASGPNAQFNGIPAGRYLLSFNDTYWGGDGSYIDAEVIYVDEGEDIVGITHVFPNGAGSSSLSGTVTLNNGDPAAGYTVSLLQRLADGSSTGNWATTDEFGYYEFAGVTSGEYSLTFSPPEDCTVDYCTTAPVDYWGGAYNENKAEFFSVADDSVLTDLDFRMLPRTSRITGTVRNAAGTVLSGVDVFVSGANGFADATTAANGTYVIEGLAPGLYTAQGSKAGYLESRLVSQAISRPAANVALGATGTINLSLAPIGGRISGKVTGSDAPTVGLEGIPVVAVRKTDMCLIGWTETDETGAYLLEGLPAGSYFVASGVRGAFGCGHSGDGAYTEQPYVGEFLTDKPNIAAATPIAVTTTSNLINQNFVLQLGASISGYVGLSDGSRGYGGLSAEAYGANDELISWATVASDGTFVIERLPAGVYYIKLSADDASMSPSWWADSTGNRLPVSVAAAQNVSGLYVDLESAAILTGTIRSRDGVTVEGRVDAVDSTGTIVASTRNRTEQEAGYSLTVPSGVPLRLRATVSGQEFWLGGASTMVASPWVTANAGNTLFVRDIAIPEPSQISGRATVSGSAISGEARLMDPAGQVVATATIRRGNYSFSGVMPGTYTVLADFWDSATFYGNKDTLATASYLTVTEGSALEGIDIDATASTAMFVPGTIAVTGVPKVGTAMSVSIGTWAPVPATILYRWYVSDPYYRGGARKAVGTAASYTVTAADLGKHLSVIVTTIKAGYVPDEVIMQLGLVSGLALTASPVPTVTGGATAKVGTVLTAAPGTWTPAPVTLSYQWMRAGTPIPGATAATYTPTVADAGTRLTVRVLGTKAGYASVLKESAQTAAVALQALTAAPVPTITGTARVGSVLTAVTGSWTPGPVGIAYQWKRNGTSIPGATGPTYLLTSEDQGRTITVAVTGNKIGFTPQTKTSAATASVSAPPAGTLTATPTPTISGTPTIDEELTVSTGTWGPAPVALTIQWFRNGVPIPGAVGAVYKLTAADVNSTIRVQVKGTKSGYTSVTKVSAATAPIESGMIDIETATATVMGDGVIGSPLTVDMVDIYPDDVYAKFQWLRDGVPIRGAKRATYTPTNRDNGCEISVVIELAKPGYFTEYLFSDSVVAYF